ATVIVCFDVFPDRQNIFPSARLKRAISSNQRSVCSEMDRNSGKVTGGDEAKKLPSPVFRFDDGETDHQDETDHQGRIRSFPHERGNWASFLYIDYKECDGWQTMQDELKALLTETTSLAVEPVDEMHLSLSKTFTIQHHNIAMFVQQLRSRLCHQRPFRLLFGGMQVYVNEERTRTFLGVRVMPHSCPPLEAIVSELDESMRDYRLPVFYETRSFHVSILWCLGDREKEMSEQLEPLRRVFERVYEEEFCDMSRPVRTLSMKCGNKSFVFELAPKHTRPRAGGAGGPVSFHVSILWCLGDREKEMSEQLEPLRRVFEQVYEDELCDMSRPVRTVTLKCGGESYPFLLAPHF
uniref:U6 snRNA phosphodiesterase n=1 Tax=Anopheles dirus TaxID=7168 RepID=A0A182N0P3_9DIPT